MHVVHVVGENLLSVKQGLACSAWHGAGCSAFGGVEGHRQPDNTASMRTAEKNVNRSGEASGSAFAGFKSGFKAALRSGTASPTCDPMSRLFFVFALNMHSYLRMTEQGRSPCMVNSDSGTRCRSFQLSSTWCMWLMSCTLMLHIYYTLQTQLKRLHQSSVHSSGTLHLLVEDHKRCGTCFSIGHGAREGVPGSGKHAGGAHSAGVRPEADRGPEHQAVRHAGAVSAAHLQHQ